MPHSPPSTPLYPYNYKHQFVVVSLSIVGVIISASVFTFFMWNLFCNDTISTCFSHPQKISPLSFLALAFLRPFTLMPLSYFAIITTQAFVLQGSLLEGFIALWLNAIISFPIAFFIGQFFHHKIVNPWLLTNVPQNIKRAQTETFTITWIFRAIFPLHYDGLSFFYGLLGFKGMPTLKATVMVEGIKSFVFASLVYILQDPLQALLYSYFYGGILGVSTLLLGQIISHYRGRSWLRRCLQIYRSTFAEIQINNDVQTSEDFQGQHPPILLLYGFFASRRTLSVIEKLLRAKGYEVFSLNLGGLFGVFFTNSIIDSARLVHNKLMHMMHTQKRQRIHIVAHSKGGLVALWWALRLGGHRHCQKIITMGTPFDGTYFTWLALVTPLGLLWKDVWQMRPRSQLLGALRDSVIPEHLQIYCFYSIKDRIAPAEKGVFKPRYGATDNVQAIPMHSLSHFEYLYRKRVAEKIHQMLQDSTTSSALSSADNTNDSGPQDTPAITTPPHHTTINHTV